MFDPAEAVVIVTGLAFAFTLIGAVKLYRDVEPRALTFLLMGTAVGTPLGVWILATMSSATLRRLIGAVLVGVALSEFRRTQPRWTHHPVAPLAVGATSGVLGGAVHAAGPPVVLYAAGRGWSGRTAKANLQAFFVVNQGLILIGYASAGFLTASIVLGMLLLALPAAVGFVLGWALFDRISEARFRQIVFGLLLLSGLTLLVRG